MRAINLDSRSTNPFLVADVRQDIGGALGQTCTFTLGNTVSIVGTVGSTSSQVVAGSPSNATLILKPVSSFGVNTGSAWTASNFAEGAVLADGLYTHTVTDNKTGAKLTITYEVDVVPGTPDRVCVKVASITPAAAALACAGTLGLTVFIPELTAPATTASANDLLKITAASDTTANVTLGQFGSFITSGPANPVAEGNGIKFGVNGPLGGTNYSVTFDLDVIPGPPNQVCISATKVVNLGD